MGAPNEQARGGQLDYREIFDWFTDAIHLIDRELRIIVINRSFQEWLQGLGLERVAAGMTIWEAFPFLPGRVRREYEEVFSSGQTHVTEETTVVDGATLHTETRKIPIVEDGVPVRVITVIRDVTERHQSMEMLIQSEKMLSVGGLAAGMAHEINNPLAVISQASEILRRRLSLTDARSRKLAEECGVDPQRARKYLELSGASDLVTSCLEEAFRASRIVQNVLSFARKAQRDFKPCDLAALVERTVELLSSQIDPDRSLDFRDIDVVSELPASVLPAVTCQAGEIQQVLFNLLTNAAEALADSSTVHPRITVALTHDEDDHVRVAISDNGPGIDEPTSRRVFEPFFTTKTTLHGTGLGLSISYFIVTEHHRGEMSLETSQGAGSTFVFRLPVDGPDLS